MNIHHISTKHQSENYYYISHCANAKGVNNHARTL